MLLRHIHLPSPTSYASAAALQDSIIAQFLAHKANPSLPKPDPTVITAAFHPTYTCGRREIGTVSGEQREYLTQETPFGRAEFYEALRGGQTTFHGPGQLVAYPVLDLRRHRLSARCYIRRLETSVITLLKQCYDVDGFTTENPGVWVKAQPRDGQGQGDASTEAKICALGVHLRRNISSHGIGLNVSTDLRWFRRIVACGLEGKGTTSLAEVAQSGFEQDIAVVGDHYVRVLAESLDGVEAVVKTEQYGMASP